MNSTATKRKITGKAAPGVIAESAQSAGADDRQHCIATAACCKAEFDQTKGRQT